MQINFENLKTALYGAATLGEDGGYLRPRRFTGKQLEYFAQEGSSTKKQGNSISGAGMHLDFYTDTQFVCMETYCVRATTVGYCYFDIYVDCEYYTSVETMPGDEGEVKVFAELPAGKKRVTIFFPAFYEINIKSFEVSDGATFEKTEKSCRILFLGDSITQGYTALHPSRSYANIVTRGLNAHCINQGIGGNVFNHNDIDPDLDFSPDTIFVAYGINDWIKNCDIKTEAHKYLDKLTNIYPDTKIYAILPIWLGGIQDAEEKTTISFEKMHETIAEVYAEFKNITVINGLELVPHDLGCFRPDKVHPQEEGFKHYGENLLKIIKG